MNTIARKAMLKHISCAYIPVSDVEASAIWYEQVLGLKLRAPIKQGRGAIMILGNGQWLFLLPAPSMLPLTFATTGWADNEMPFEMFPISFETDDIQPLYLSLKEAGAWLEAEIRDEGSCGLQLDFKDPDGNKFQVHQPPKK
jgi:glyoxylase I family protein